MSTAVPRISGRRWQVIADLVGPDAGSVLDIGCRGRELRDHLPAGARYTGLDLEPPADVIANAEERLPFDDDSFEVAVLADVLEHLDNPHGALDEAMRVSSRAVVVLLPNIFTLRTRLHFLFGRMGSGKYDFGPDERRDRHRWITRFDQAREFTRGRAARSGWKVAREGAFDGGFRHPVLVSSYAVARALGGPNLWAWEYVARLEPAAAAENGAG